jgi:hypothetical protein
MIVEVGAILKNRDLRLGLNTFEGSLDGSGLEDEGTSLSQCIALDDVTLKLEAHTMKQFLLLLESDICYS